jgi:hypothetical protein
MAKYVLEDMVRAKRARKTPAEAPAGAKKQRISEVVKDPFVPVSRPMKVAPRIVPPTVTTRTGNPRYTLWFVAFLSLLFFAFAASFLFSSAAVTVTPRTETLPLQETFSANSEPISGGLFFDLVVISGEEKKNIAATEEKEVALRSTGTAIIINSWSTSAQKLSIDTRLEGSNGKLYKTKTAITVPGMSSDGTAGSVEVEIYGAEPGEEYNSGPIDFQIVGFKGTPKYDKFQVRTKPGTEIKGGFRGMAAVVSDEEKLAAGTELRSLLREELTTKASEQTPPGFILFKDAVFLDAADRDLDTAYNTDKSITLTQKGTLYGLLFNEQRLTTKIAEGSVDDYDGSEVYISNMDDLEFRLAEDNTVPFSELKNATFNLSGSAEMVWKIDERKFVHSLLGQAKEDFTDILAQYPNIESAVLKVTPPWRSSIPENKEEVKIIVKYPKGGE